MADPKQVQLTFSLGAGIDTVAEEENVQPQAALRASRNCRLSSNGQSLLKQPACATVAVRALTGTGGIVPLASEDSNVILNRPASGLRRASGTAEAPLVAVVSPDETQNQQSSYFPVRVSSRVVPAGVCWAPGAVAVDFEGRVYTAQVDRNGILLVTVCSAQGELLVAPTPIASVGIASGSVPAWVGVTTHNNSVYVWYTNGPVLTRRTLTVSGLTLVAGASSPVSGITANDSLNFICSIGGQYAFFVTNEDGTNNVRVWTVDPATGSTTSALLTTSGAAVGQVHIAAYSASSVVNLSVFVGTVTDSYWYIIDSGLLVLRTETWAAGYVGHSAFATQTYADVPGVTTWATLTRTSATNEVEAGEDIGMEINSVPFNGVGFMTPTLVVPWMRCLAASTWEPESNEAYALFAAVPCYSGSGIPFPTEPNYVIDPSIAVFLTRAPRKGPDVAPIARLGVDTAVVRPNDFYTAPHMGNLFCAGNKAYLNYLARRNTPVDATFTVGATLDFLSHQTRYALASRSATTIASGMPASWDGVELTEAGFLFSPRVVRDPADAGDPGDLPVGTHGFIAVWAWRDAQGDLHRSYPSPAYQVTISGADEEVHLLITQPACLRNSQSMFGVSLEVYQTQTDGTVFYRQEYAPVFFSDGFVRITTDSASVGPENPILFTTGEAGQPLAPVTPPAATAGCVVGDRCFLVSAEQPDEVWPSHKKEAGIAWEWSSEMVVKFPASAGSLVAAIEASGTPVFLSDRGAWALQGDGPNRMLVGSFAPPQQMSAIPCTDGGSALSTPVGIMYRSGNRFANIQKGLDPRVDLSNYAIVSAYLDTDNQEAVWVTQDQTALVYAYAADQWRTWALPAANNAALSPRTKQVLLYNGATLSHLSLNSVDATQQCYFETGWVLLGDIQDDNQIQDIVFQAKRASSHGVVVTIQLDYQTPVVLSRTFTAAEVASLATNGRYTLMVSPKTMSCRALKVTVTETDAAGTAMQPIGVTVVYGKLPGTLRAAVLRQGRK